MTLELSFNIAENTTGKNEPIESDKVVEEIRAEPLTLPNGFIWDDVDINDANQVKSIFLAFMVRSEVFQTVDRVVHTLK